MPRNYWSPVNLEDPVFQILAYDEYEKVGFDYSATELIDSPRAILLNKRHGDNVDVNVQMNSQSVQGTALHSHAEKVLSKLDYEVICQEERIIIDIEGRKVGFKPDFAWRDLEAQKNKLIDFKLRAYFKSFSESAKPEDTMQSNFYRWAIWKRLGILIDEAKIAEFTRDYSYRDSQILKKSNCPDWPVNQLPVTLWDLDKTEEILREKILKLIELEDVPDDELPECTDADRWADPEVYAVVYTNGKTKGNAVPKGGRFELLEQAQVFKADYDAKQANKKKDQRTTEIQLRISESKRCNRGYCLICNECNQWQKLKVEWDKVNE